MEIFSISHGKRLQIHLLLLLLSLQMSVTNQVEDNLSNGFEPCLATFSIRTRDQCVQCIQSISSATACAGSQSQKSHSGAKQTSSCGTEKVFMCPPPNTDLELAKIAYGRKFLNGNTIRIVTIERHPFVKKFNGQYTGAVFEIVYAFQKKYNFTSKIFLPYDGNWGSLSADGTWNGMVGQVLRKEADMGAAGFSVTLERAKAIDFSMSYHQEPTAILIPAPQPGSKLTILIRPLSFEVWLAVCTTICVLVPSLFVMHIVSLRIRGKADLHKPVNAVRLIGDLFQFIVGSLVQESLVSPVNKTTRFLVVIWWFLTLVMANIYLGYMVSFLSAPKLYDIVDSLEALVLQHNLRWTYRKGTAVDDLFRSSPSGIYHAIGMGVRQEDLVTNDVAGVEKALSGQFAFLKERSYLDVALGADFEKKHECRMTIAKETFFTVGTAVIVQKGCAFLELLDREILNVVTTGLMEKWKAIHWPQNLFCVDAASYIIKTQPKTRKLNLDDFQGAYFLLLCGLSASTTSFLLERLKFHYQSRMSGEESDTTTARGNEAMKNYKIIVISVKEADYRKLSVFKFRRAGINSRVPNF